MLSKQGKCLQLSSNTGRSLKILARADELAALLAALNSSMDGLEAQSLTRGVCLTATKESVAALLR